MPGNEKKKSSSRSRKGSVSRRSRSRTRKTNGYLLVGREPSVSQTRITATLSVHRHTNGRINQTEATPSTPPPLLAIRSRPFTTKPHDDVTTVRVDMVSVIVFSVALGVRLWHISDPDSIVFDEQICGSHISSYLRGEMYFSFDPPLHTQIMTSIGRFCGMNGDFDFNEVGKRYVSSIPYTTLRLVSCMLGALLSPMVYHLMRLSGTHVLPAFIPALLIATDPALIVQSRIFTSDSMVITLCMILLFSAVKYSVNTPTGSSALSWLLLCGVLSGAVISMKYSAAFTILIAYFFIWSKFWSSIAMIQYKTRELWCNFLVLVIAVVIIPVCIYMTSWNIHVSWLTRANSREITSHQSSLSSSLQLTETRFTPKIITNGSIITLQHIHGRDCWLHSHNLLYPKRYADGRGSSHQQQVTCYPFVDQNNKWIIYKLPYEHDNDDKIRDGDEISLIHESTGKYLNSHIVAAPVQSSKQEVSGYVEYNITDISPQTSWVVEIDSLEDNTAEYWIARKSHIKLIHVNTSAALSVTSNQLPDWAGGQYEVVADPFIFHENTLWLADDVINPQPQSESEAQMTSHKTSTNSTVESAATVLLKIYEIHKRIFVHSYRYEEEHQFSSTPLSWITSTANLIYWIHPTDNTEIHMLPNPLSWTVGVTSIVLLCLILTLSELRAQRVDNSQAPQRTPHNGPNKPYILAIGGFLANIVPYLLTDQPLLLYNYLPALVFVHMGSGYLIHALLKSSSWCCCRLLTLLFTSILTVSSLCVTVVLSPLIYGTGTLNYDIHKLATNHLGWQFLNDNELHDNH